LMSSRTDTPFLCSTARRQWSSNKRVLVHLPWCAPFWFDWWVEDPDAVVRIWFAISVSA
jgi:hypothetical protein